MNLSAWLYPYPKQKIHVALKNGQTDMISFHTFEVTHYLKRSATCLACWSINLEDKENKDALLNRIEHEGIEVIGRFKDTDYSIIQTFCPNHQLSYNIRHNCSEKTNEIFSDMKAEGIPVLPEEGKVILLEGKFSSITDLAGYMGEIYDLLLTNESKPLFSEMCVSAIHSKRNIQGEGCVFQKLMDAGRIYLCIVVKPHDLYYSDMGIGKDSFKVVAEKSLEYFTSEDERIYDLLFQPGSRHLRYRQLLNLAHDQALFSNFVRALFTRPSIYLADP